MNLVTVVILLLIVAGLSAEAGGGGGTTQQDLTFRLINLERQVESLQVRIDFLERTVRSISGNGATGAQNDGPDRTSLTLDIQRQLLSLAEQQIVMQTQMLEMRKSIDRLAELTPVVPPKKDLPSRKPSGN
ncbi:MAG: hypothetical protein EBU88_15420 [Acidobacteria bacterium]|nr:hypothetical protein [Acidobacteriota bacterium]